MSALLAAVLALVLGAGTSSPAQAAPNKLVFVDCESFGIPTNRTEDVPVLMVHGFRSNPNVWAESPVETSMANTIAMIRGAYAVAPFDYSQVNTKWVTHSEIGEKLAKTIYCWGKTSPSGRVVVLAHSMGGLALREAAQVVIDGFPVARRVGLAITIGTPHRGSPWATAVGVGLVQYCLSPTGRLLSLVRGCVLADAIRAMQPGSRELAQLPSMPPTMPLRAIAGDVTLYDVLNNGYGTRSDLVVPVSSATAQYTTGYPGDGVSVESCTAEMFFLLYFGLSACEHNALLHNPGVQASVIAGIGEYVRSLAPSDDPAPGPTILPQD